MKPTFKMYLRLDAINEDTSDEEISALHEAFFGPDIDKVKDIQAEKDRLLILKWKQRGRDAKRLSPADQERLPAALKISQDADKKFGAAKRTDTEVKRAKYAFGSTAADMPLSAFK